LYDYMNIIINVRWSKAKIEYVDERDWRECNEKLVFSELYFAYFCQIKRISSARKT
jgi:hypothetical protein